MGSAENRDHLRQQNGRQQYGYVIRHFDWPEAGVSPAPSPTTRKRYERHEEINVARALNYFSVDSFSREIDSNLSAFCPNFFRELLHLTVITLLGFHHYLE